MIALRVLIVALFLLSTAGRLSAQIDLDAIENATGRNMIEQLKKATKECKSTFVSALNDKLFAAISAKGIIARAPEFYIFNFQKMNAFAIPSGKIIITTAFMAALRSSNEYAAVMMHEVGHIQLGHSRQNMMIEAARSLVFPSDAVKIPVLLARLRYSRSQEMEADQFAAKALTEIGIAPASLGDALLRISANSLSNSGSDLFSTHPLTSERIKMLNDYRQDIHVAGAAIALPAWSGIDISCR